MNEKDCREKGYEGMREHWFKRKGEETKVMFIGESPPVKKINYFYFCDENGTQRGMVGGLLKPLEYYGLISISKTSSNKKCDRVKNFVECYWLEDIFSKPIENMTEEDLTEKEFSKRIDEFHVIFKELQKPKIVCFLPASSFKKRSMKIFCAYQDIELGGDSSSIQHSLIRNIFGDKIKSKIAPFPCRGQINSLSFRMWVEQNREWLDCKS